MKIQKSPKKAKRKLGELIRNSKNNPILLDTNIISFSGGGVLDLLRYKKLSDVEFKKLKELRLYSSFIWSLVNSEERISTVPEVVKETKELVKCLQNVYERRNMSYHYEVKDALMHAAYSKNAENPQALRVLSELKAVTSRLEKIVFALETRAEKYRGYNKNLDLIGGIVGQATYYAEKSGAIKKVSKADIDLVMDAFYETLFFSKTPLILSEDKDINRIICSAFQDNYFPSEIKELLIKRIGMHRVDRT